MRRLAAWIHTHRDRLVFAALVVGWLLAVYFGGMPG
jgi:hypothetical protein